MAFLKKIEIEEGVIGLWELTNSLSDFEPIIPLPAGDPEFKTITSEKRRIEYLAVRALLIELLGKYVLVEYKNDGAPYLPNESYNISISHSKNLVAIILHKKRVGIDVEITGRPITKIAHKFISEVELDFVMKSDEKEKSMLLIWCAKEAVFKLTDEQGIDFKTRITIKPFNIKENGKIYAIFKHKNKTSEISLQYLFVKQNALVWCNY